MLPTHKPRFAVTLWFIDGQERDHIAATLSAAAAAAAAAANAETETGLDVKETARAESTKEEEGRVGKDEDLSVQNKTNEVPSSEMSAPPVTLLRNANGEVGAWCAEEQCLLYQVHFRDPLLVPLTLVDVVNKNMLFIHTTDDLFVSLEIPIDLPAVYVQYSIQENKTTAKYNRKKSILSVRLFFSE